ncbi:AAA domain-containing protein [Microbacterium sp. B2969]|uniref:AAA domain-containing protein n=1 Tax=Microbacterium alkaliflavum TaxID=3248839 RepID=A0ABW7QEC8_9MICO
MSESDVAASPVARASQEWKSALIDVSGTNRLLHFKKTSTTLALDVASESALLRLLKGGTVSVGDLFRVPADADRAKRACAALARKEREATEEYGVSVTYLALGFATWNPDTNRVLHDAEAAELDQPAGAIRRGPVPNAPVLLRPIRIVRRRGVTEDWQLQLTDDYQLNGVLLHLLNFGSERVDDDALLDTAEDLEAVTDLTQFQATLSGVLNGLSADCREIDGFQARPELVVGTFSYQKQPMVNDVADLDALGLSDIAAALAGDADAAARVRAAASDVPVSESDPDYAPVDSEYLVLDADASQSYVVNAALAGRNLVVQGPPGTGKSQTIANVISALIASGKHVLFVAQKRAAITAVLDRLSAVDLSHLLLDLFAADGSRRFVAEQLRIVLERQQQVGTPDTAELHAKLENARRRLVSHNDALFSPTHAWGASIHELRVSSLGFAPAAQATLRLPPATFATWAKTTLGRLAEDLDEVDSLGALSPAWTTTPGWRPGAMSTVDEAERLRQLALSLRWEHLPKLRQMFAAEAAASGHAAPTGLTDADPLVNLHRDGLEAAATAPSLLSDADLDAMISAVSRPHRRELPDVRWGRRRAGKRAVRELLSSLSPTQQLDLLLKARAVRGAWNTGGAPQPYPGADETAALLARIRDEVAQLDAATQGISPGTLRFDELERALEAMVADTRGGVMARANTLEGELRTAGVGSVLDLIRSHYGQGKTLACAPSEVLRWVAVRSVLESAELTTPAIAGVRGAELSTATATFQRADQSHLAANAARVRRQAAVHLKSAFDEFPDQHAALKTEVTRKRNFRPVRRLFHEASDVLLAAKPVWAMSPLQVSRILPATQCFDVVIFDEASQVKPADAIPALMRGRQVIVAGDSRQLPPTEFFSKVLEEDEIEETDEDVALSASEVQASEPAVARRGSYTRDAESILFAMDRLLAGQSRSLQWHYRSRDERLIAVSNEYVYQGSLTTFPAPDALESVRHEVVPYSAGIGGGTNSPELEVQRVVDLVKQQVAQHPGESVGIIAFGIKHEARIERAIELAMLDDPEFEAALTAHPQEPWFVKAIERVQGDERDAVFLSVGYGKSADGRLRYFWGPLLRDGGERRLNVAISRAKKRMTLVTSFTADDVAPDGHSSAGYALMHRFVRFMASRGTSLTDGVRRAVPLNPFEFDVKTRLEAAGLVLDPQVGVGDYRIDFAARHPDLPGRHVLAIEADGAAYHSGHIARERDRLRQELLERRGWAFHRIWSTDWFNDADGEVRRAIGAFDHAIRSGETPTPVTAPAVEAPSWREGSIQRKVPRPQLPSYESITDIPMSTLVGVVRYIRSDDILRSGEEEQRLVMRELGFSKLGSRIQAAIAQAQTLASRSG